MLLGLLGLSAAAALTPPAPARACAPALPAPALAGADGPRPTAPDDCVTPDRAPGRHGGVERGLPLPWIAAEPGQPVVAGAGSTLTGSAVTMTGLRLEGIVDLPVADGTVRTLKFRMDRAVIDDALLRSPGPAGRSTRLTSQRLIVQGEVEFYATRITGRLRGVEFTLTPNLAYAVPVASAGPVTFTYPAIDLAFATGDVLAAGPRSQLTLDGP